MGMRRVMVTTKDNPYDPFKDFNNWFIYDSTKGYNTCSYLSRVARTSDSLSESLNSEYIEKAIDEIIKYDFMNIYKKIVIEDDTDD